MQTAYIIGAICILIGIGAMAFLLITMKKSKNNPIRASVKKGSGRKNSLYYLYRFYTECPGLNRYFDKFKTRLSILYPADSIEINRLTTKTMTKSLLIAGVSAVVLGFLSKDDLFYMFVSIFAVYIIFADTIAKSISKMELKLLKEFADFLTDVRSNYYSTHMIEDALYQSLEEAPYGILLHANKIYEIINSPNVEEKMEEYTDIAPNRFFELFTAVCATIKEFGDKEVADSGESLFLKNINYIKEEVYVEITKMEKNTYLFAGLVPVCIAPMFALKLIEKWANSIEGLASFYEGPIGKLVIIAEFVAAIVCFELISNLRDGSVSHEKEHPFWDKLASMPYIRKISTDIVNWRYTKFLRIADALKMTGNHISPQGYLVQRMTLSLACGVLALFMVTGISITNAQNILHNFKADYEDAIVPSDEYRQEMRTLSEQYLKSHKHVNAFTEEETLALIEELKQEEGMNEMLATQVAENVAERSDQYAKNYFKWWYVFIVLGAAAAGYYAPYLLLKYQLSIMKFSMEDEVAQFRALALIFMNVDGMTLDSILEWMERLAFVFRQSISECILNLESSQAEAIRKMKESESFPPFRRFCDNLTAIDEVGVSDAFRDIVTEQENYKQQRALKNEITMARKSSIAKDLSYIPMGIAVVGYLIFPFVQYAFEMLKSMSSALQY